MQGFQQKTKMPPLAETAVSFSAGVESTAALFAAIETYGKERVVAITVAVGEEKLIFTQSHQFYVRALCKTLGIPLFTVERSAIQGLEHIKDLYDWSHNARMFAMGNEQIKRVWYGAHKNDDIHTHVLLNEKWFAEAMQACGRDCVLERPLHRLTKQEQYDSIPAEYRKFLWTCPYPTSAIIRHGSIRGYTPCGVCGKCEETKRYVRNHGTHQTH